MRPLFGEVRGEWFQDGTKLMALQKIFTLLEAYPNWQTGHRQALYSCRQLIIPSGPVRIVPVRIRFGKILNIPIFSVTVELPGSTSIQYKYIRINNGQITWESDPNMEITTPSSGSYIENDVWR